MRRFDSPTARRAVLTWTTLISSLVFLFVARAIVARILGPTAVGMYVLMLTAGLLGGTLLSFGLPAYNASFAAEHPRRVLLANSIAWTGAIFVVLSVVCLPTLLFGRLPPSRQFLVFGVWMAPVTALLECTRGVLQGSNSIAAYNWVAFIAGALNLSCIAVLSATVGLTLPGAVLSWVLSVGVSLMLGVWLGLRGEKLGRPDFAVLAGSLRFGGQAWLSQLAGVVNIRIAVVLIEVLLGTAAVGIYAIAATIGEVLLYFPNALAAVTVARYGSASRADAARLVVRSSLFVLLVNAGCAAAVALVARPMIMLAFGAEYEASVPLLLVLLPGVVLYSPVAVTTWYFNAHLKRPSLNLVVASFSAICGAALIGILAPSHGLVGVALATTCGYAAASALNIVILQRSSKLSYAHLIDAARHAPRRAVPAPGAPE